MRAITLPHPQAFQVAFLGADYVPLDWRESLLSLPQVDAVLRHKETIAIHGGKPPSGPTQEAAFERRAHFLRMMVKSHPDLERKWRAEGVWNPGDLVRPGIIAIADVVGTTHAPPPASRWGLVGALNLMLSNIRPTGDAIGIRGAPAFWEVPKEIELALLARLNRQSLEALARLREEEDTFTQEQVEARSKELLGL